MSRLLMVFLCLLSSGCFSFNIKPPTEAEKFEEAKRTERARRGFLEERNRTLQLEQEVAAQQTVVRLQNLWNEPIEPPKKEVIVIKQPPPKKIPPKKEDKKAPAVVAPPPVNQNDGRLQELLIEASMRNFREKQAWERMRYFAWIDSLYRARKQKLRELYFDAAWVKISATNPNYVVGREPSAVPWKEQQYLQEIVLLDAWLEGQKQDFLLTQRLQEEAALAQLRRVQNRK